MNQIDQLLPLVILIAIPIYIFVIRRGRAKLALLGEKRDQLKSLHKREAIFICHGADDVGDNLIQFYGEPFGMSVRPGTKITIPSGVEYTVKEVYADDSTPDKPDLEVPVGTSNAAIVIESSSWDWKSFKQNLKDEGLVVLKLR